MAAAQHIRVRPPLEGLGAELLEGDRGEGVEGRELDQPPDVPDLGQRQLRPCRMFSTAQARPRVKCLGSRLRGKAQGQGICLWSKLIKGKGR